MRLSALLPLLAAALALAAASAQGALAAAPVRVVALTGDPVPGLPGVTIAALDLQPLSDAVIDGEGRVVFDALLAGAGVDASNDLATLRAEGGSLSVLLREDDPVPGIAGGLVRVAGTAEAVTNAEGHLALRIGLTGSAVTAANDEAVLVDRGSGLELLLREGEAVPGLGAGSVFESLGALRLDGSGRVALRSLVSSGGQAIVRDGTGGLELVAAFGGTPPGVEPGATYGLLDAPSVNATGQIAFGATLANVAAGTEDAVFSEGFGPLDIVAREGSSVPGEPGETFASIFDVRIDAAGRVAFGDGLGTFVQRPSGFEALGREGDAVPGLAPGTTFGFPTADPAELAADGTVASLTTLEGSGVTAENDRLIWRDAGGGLAALLRTGDVALSAGTTPVVFTFFDDLDPVALEDGTLLVDADLRGNLVDASNDESLWQVGADGDPVLLLREGDPIEVSPADERTIGAIPVLAGFFTQTGVAGVGTGGPRSFNARGEIALAVPFQDASEALLVVPEPGAGAAGLAALAGLTALRAARSGRAGRGRAPRRGGRGGRGAPSPSPR